MNRRHVVTYRAIAPGLSSRVLATTVERARKRAERTGRRHHVAVRSERQPWPMPPLPVFVVTEDVVPAPATDEVCS